MKVFFQTDDSWSSLILRVMLGIVIFPHGAMKFLGWFGGPGFSGTMGFFADKLHIPVFLTFLVIITEFFGSLGLIVGFLSRISALGIGIIMIVAIWMVHWPNGFFMNWFGKQAGEGFEFHLLALAMSAALVISGSGKWSIDKIIASNLKD